MHNKDGTSHNACLPITELFEFPKGQVDPRNAPFRDWILVGPEHIESSTGRLLASVSAKEQRAVSGKYVAEPGDVIYSKIRPNLRKATIAPIRCLCSADTYALRPKPNVQSRYLLELLLGDRFTTFACSVSARSGIPKLNRSEFSEFTTTIPPEVVQRHLAEVIEALDRAIQSSERVITKLEMLKRGLLHELLTGEADETRALRTAGVHTRRACASPLGQTRPHSWPIVRLVEQAEIRAGIAKNENAVLNSAVEVPYLRVANVQDGYVDLFEMKTIRVDKLELDSYRLLPGDVLMNEGGDRDKLGRGAVWMGQIDPCVHQNHVFAVRCSPTLLPAFLAAWTSSDDAKRYFQLTGQQSIKLASINKTQVGQLPIPLPPLEEQLRIVAILSSHTMRIEVEQSVVRKLTLLRHGLTDDLLTGRVRVSPHPR